MKMWHSRISVETLSGIECTSCVGRGVSVSGAFAAAPCAAPVALLHRRRGILRRRRRQGRRTVSGRGGGAVVAGLPPLGGRSGLGGRVVGAEVGLDLRRRDVDVLGGRGKVGGGLGSGRQRLRDPLEGLVGRHPQRLLHLLPPLGLLLQLLLHASPVPLLLLQPLQETPLQLLHLGAAATAGFQEILSLLRLGVLDGDLEQRLDVPDQPVDGVQLAPLAPVGGGRRGSQSLEARQPSSEGGGVVSAAAVVVVGLVLFVLLLLVVVVGGPLWVDLLVGEDVVIVVVDGRDRRVSRGDGRLAARPRVALLRVGASPRGERGLGGQVEPEGPLWQRVRARHRRRRRPGRPVRHRISHGAGRPRMHGGRDGGGRGRVPSLALLLQQLGRRGPLLLRQPVLALPHPFKEMRHSISHSVSKRFG